MQPTRQFLEKIKLIDCLTLEVEISKNDFYSKMKSIIDEGSTSVLFDPFDAFSSSTNEYKGHVGYDKFNIKKRRKMFDMNMNFAKAKGTYKQKNNSTEVDVQINGYSAMIPFLTFLIIFYSIFIAGLTFGNNNHGEMGAFALPFILLHALFMFGLPYFIMRRSVSKLKHDLERELYFLTR